MGTLVSRDGMATDGSFTLNHNRKSRNSSQRSFPSAVIEDRNHPAPELLATQTGSCSPPAVYGSQVSEVCWLVLDLYTPAKSHRRTADFTWRLAHIWSISSKLMLILYGQTFRPTVLPPLPFQMNAALTSKGPCSFSSHLALFSHTSYSFFGFVYGAHEQCRRCTAV